MNEVFSRLITYLMENPFKLWERDRSDSAMKETSTLELCIREGRQRVLVSVKRS